MNWDIKPSFSRMRASAFGPLSDSFALHLGFKGDGFAFENVEKKFLGTIRSVNLLDRLQQFESELITFLGKKIVSAARQPINHFGPSHFLWAAPGVEIPIALEGEAMLFDAHVAHLHFHDELVHGQTFRPLERVQNFKPLCAANLGKQFLVQSNPRIQRLLTTLREKLKIKQQRKFNRENAFRRKPVFDGRGASNERQSNNFD